MKKLHAILTSCMDCPARVCDEWGIVSCNNQDIPKEITEDDFEAFPKWCPLPEAVVECKSTASCAFSDPISFPKNCGPCDKIGEKEAL